MTGRLCSLYFEGWLVYVDSLLNICARRGTSSDVIHTRLHFQPNMTYTSGFISLYTHTHNHKMISWRLAFALVPTVFKGILAIPGKEKQTWPTFFNFRFQAAIEKVFTVYSKCCIGNPGCDGFVHCSDMGVEHIQKPNSWTYNLVKGSGHNFESSQTWGFCVQCLHYKPASNRFWSRRGRSKIPK